MNKAGLVQYMKEATGLNGAQIEKALNAVFFGIASALKKKEDVSFVGFGSFSVIKRAAREGRNPRTGEKLKIKASNQVRFRAGKDLKEAFKG